MSDTERTRLPLGMYKMVRIESDGELPISVRCGECSYQFETDTPILEVTRRYARIGASCPNCGVGVSLAHLNVMKLTCVPSIDPEHT